MIFLVKWLQCLLWSGHKAEVKIEPNKKHDSVFCARCGSVQGNKAWRNYGLFWWKPR